jgi:hypothetical protein
LKLFFAGGQWINLGPLLYHFADIAREPSIEPPYDVSSFGKEQRNLTLPGETFIPTDSSKSLPTYLKKTIQLMCKKLF